MLSGLLGIGVHENILWPDIPYVTDQHGSKEKIVFLFASYIFNWLITIKH